jgi:hypothetical protein
MVKEKGVPKQMKASLRLWLMEQCEAFADERVGLYDGLFVQAVYFLGVDLGK